jgi:pyroglutamyl-peptidase
MTEGMKITLTGFGKFEGVSENPTELIINDFIVKNSSLATEYRVMKVAVEDVLKHCSEFDYSNSAHLILHLGVHSSASSMLLEKYGYNNMTFRVIDEAGFQPENQCISSECPFDESLETDFDLDQIVDKMREEGRFNCCVSTDPGRYLCNYVYYQSLTRAQSCSGKKFVLFLHVPPLHVMSLDEQIQFIARCVPLLAEQVKARNNQNSEGNDV